MVKCAVCGGVVGIVEGGLCLGCLIKIDDLYLIDYKGGVKNG